MHTEPVKLSEAISQVISTNKSKYLEWVKVPNSTSYQYIEQVLEELTNPAFILGKLNHELGHYDYQPLGKVLVVVSESYPLATLMSAIALLLTGNQGLIKANSTMPIVSHFLDELAQYYQHGITIEDWAGIKTFEYLNINNFDGVLLGGGEDLIEHFRAKTPAPIRLIEFGPKISVIALKKSSFSSEQITDLFYEYNLFAQQVCSSPRFLIVSDEHAKGIFNLLIENSHLLEPFNYEQRLQQSNLYKTLRLLGKAKNTLYNSYFDVKTGWIIEWHNDFDNLPDAGCIRIISGTISVLLDKISTLYRNRTQVLGYAGFSFNELMNFKFTRICPLGLMHQRSHSNMSSHDGFFELMSLVNIRDRI